MLEELSAVAGFALVGALVTTALRSALLGDALTAAPMPIVFLLGVATGMLASCTLGSIAFAASVHSAAPALAGGVLCSAGVFALHARWAPNAAHHELHHSVAARPLYGAMALACAIVAARGGATLVHPKLVLWIALGAALASLNAFRTDARTRRSTTLPVLLMLAAALSPNAAVQHNAPAAAFDTLVLGERVRLSAQIAGGARTTLVRYAITCCRADAAPVAVRLDRVLGPPPGSWVTVDGTVGADSGGLVVHVTGARAIPPPADPFLYR